jgi:hypothetical protein
VVATILGLAVGYLWGSGGRHTGGAPVAASHSPSPGSRVLNEPVARLCHQYSRDTEEGNVEESTPFPCDYGRTSHDALTVAVVDHPAVQLPFNGPPPTDAAVPCQHAAEHYLGIGPGVTFSRYSSTVFEPDAAQIAAGQRWLRCDLVRLISNGLMPFGQPQGSLHDGPDLTDAYCVSPDALAYGLPAEGTTQEPELGNWDGQTDCYGSHALIAVRRATAASPTDAAAACTRESRRFRSLTLTPLVPPPSAWEGEALCVARIVDYENWLAKGKLLTNP